MHFKQQEADMANTKTQATSPARTFQTVNPATGGNGRAYQGHSVAQAASIAADVHQAQIAWRRVSFHVRSALMAKAAQVIRENRERYAKLMTDEMGKTVTDVRLLANILRHRISWPAMAEC
jgi:acyl-CoA reductase-like NAD-dependent aldehyde dehydrogenase